jgi:hypothetical protein
VVSLRRLEDHRVGLIVPAAGVAPHVLIDANDLDAVEAVRILDQDALSRLFANEGVVAGW